MMPEEQAPHQGHTIAWNVITHVHQERSNDWYWALGVIAIVAAGLCVWFGNVLFGIILVMGAGSLGIMVARGPREHRVAIDNRGIAIDGTLYPYRSLESFWIPHDEEEPRLYLTTRGVFMPHLSLQLESRAQGEQVRSFLKRSVKEEEQEPHLGEHVAQMLGL